MVYQRNLTIFKYSSTFSLKQSFRVLFSSSSFLTPRVRDVGSTQSCVLLAQGLTSRLVRACPVADTLCTYWWHNKLYTLMTVYTGVPKYHRSVEEAQSTKRSRIVTWKKRAVLNTVGSSNKVSSKPSVKDIKVQHACWHLAHHPFRAFRTCWCIRRPM